MVRIVKDPQQRKDEIIEAACQLFLSKGYDNTTMKDVMVQLDIAKGTIYHYFKSKDELLEAVIMSVVDNEMHHMEITFEQSEGTALERMKQLAISGTSRHGEADHNELLNDLHQPANAGMHIRLMAQLITRQAPLYAQIIEQGCKEGLFSTSTPLECAEFLLAGIQFLIDNGVYPWTTPQLERRWNAFPELLESLLQAPTGSFSFLHEISAGAPHSESST